MKDEARFVGSFPGTTRREDECPPFVQIISRQVQNDTTGQMFNDIEALGDDGRVYHWDRSTKTWYRLPIDLRPFRARVRE